MRNPSPLLLLLLLPPCALAHPSTLLTAAPLSTSPALQYPMALAYLGTELYVASAGEHRVVVLSGAGAAPAAVSGGPLALRVLAGDGKAGFSGDGGPAVLARFNAPYGIVLRARAEGGADAYIADTYNNRVRLVDGATGRVSTVAGSGRRVWDGDGVAATEAALNR